MCLTDWVAWYAAWGFLIGIVFLIVGLPLNNLFQILFGKLDDYDKPIEIKFYNYVDYNDM